jgi:hypothetical protein
VSPFLSPKDYERVYWPTFKKMIDYFLGLGHRVWVFFENNQEQHLERLQDLPKGKIVAHLESTDLERAKKALGGRICIAAGMPARLLVRGTPEDVKEQTLSVLKIFEDEPGFIMTCDTTVPVGAKAENIDAWLKAVKEYGHIGGKLRIPQKPKDAVEDHQSPGIERTGTDSAVYTPWESVRADFGKIAGDEGIIKENWDGLEKSLLPLIYWLIK